MPCRASSTDHLHAKFITPQGLSAHKTLLREHKLPNMRRKIESARDLFFCFSKILNSSHEAGCAPDALAAVSLAERGRSPLQAHPELS